MNPETENKIQKLIDNLEMLTDAMLLAYTQGPKGSDCLVMIRIVECLQALEKLDYKKSVHYERCKKIERRGSMIVDLFNLANKARNTEEKE